MSVNIINPERQEADVSIRPETLEDFTGQTQVVENLKIFIQAAKLRNEALDHILFSGPPGLGKTTLARILASEQGANFYEVSAPKLKRPGDIAKILTTLEKNDILFIDEVHRLTAIIEESLYPAMEDRKIDITLSEGMASTSVQIDLPPFTLVGATTKPGSISAPLRDRFGIHETLKFYDIQDIEKIIARSVKLWKIKIDKDAIHEIAIRSRRTPRIALRLTRRIWDFAIVENGIDVNITSQLTIKGFQKLGIDELGLTELEISMMTILAENYNGGPTGLKPLAAIISEDIISLEDFIEPFLVRSGLIQRTSRGRILTDKAYKHLNITANTNRYKQENNSQKGLFDENK